MNLNGKYATQHKYLSNPENYEKHKIAVRNRVARNMEKLPELFDECDQCGLDDDLKVYYYTDTGRIVPTTMVSKVYTGWGMKRVANFIRDNDLLCKFCADEIREERKLLARRGKLTSATRS